MISKLYHKAVWSKAISLCVALMMFVQQSVDVYAYPSIQSQPTTPIVQSLNLDGFGSLSATYISSNSNLSAEEAILNPNQKLLIYVEDAHGNISAQKNIAEIIRLISEKANLKQPWIALEGTEPGEIDHSLLSDHPDHEMRSLIADYFIRLGELDGADYYTAHYNPDAKHFGVDSPELVKRNQQSYQSFLKLRTHIEKSMVGLIRANEILKEKIYQEDLITLDKLSSQDLDEQTQFNRELNVLEELAIKHEIDVSLFPSFQMILELKKLETRLQNEEAQKSVHQIAEQLKSADIVKDIEGVKEALWNKLAFYREARDARLIDRAVSFYRKLFDFQMTPRDYHAYLDNPHLYSIDTLKAAIKRYHFALRPKTLRPSDDELWLMEQAAKHALTFYETAHLRNEPLANHLMDLVRENTESKTFFIGGGFHREALMEIFKKHELPFLVITPNISSRDGQDNYWRLMAEQEDVALPPQARSSEFKLRKPHANADFRNRLRAHFAAFDRSPVLTSHRDDRRQQVQPFKPELSSPQLSSSIAQDSSGWTLIRPESGRTELLYLGAADQPVPSPRVARLDDGFRRVHVTHFDAPSGKRVRAVVYRKGTPAKRSEVRLTAVEVKDLEFPEEGGDAPDRLQRFAEHFGETVAASLADDDDLKEVFMAEAISDNLMQLFEGADKDPVYMAQRLIAAFNNRKVQIVFGEFDKMFAVRTTKNAPIRIEIDKETHMSMYEPGIKSTRAEKRPYMPEAFFVVGLRHYLFDSLFEYDDDENKSVRNAALAQVLVERMQGHPFYVGLNVSTSRPAIDYWSETLRAVVQKHTAKGSQKFIGDLAKNMKKVLDDHEIDHIETEPFELDHDGEPGTWPDKFFNQLGASMAGAFEDRGELSDLVTAEPLQAALQMMVGRASGDGDTAPEFGQKLSDFVGDRKVKVVFETYSRMFQVKRSHSEVVIQIDLPALKTFGRHSVSHHITEIFLAVGLSYVFVHPLAELDQPARLLENLAFANALLDDARTNKAYIKEAVPGRTPADFFMDALITVMDHKYQDNDMAGDLVGRLAGAQTEIFQQREVPELKTVERTITYDVAGSGPAAVEDFFQQMTRAISEGLAEQEETKSITNASDLEYAIKSLHKTALGGVTAAQFAEGMRKRFGRHRARIMLGQFDKPFEINESGVDLEIKIDLDSLIYVHGEEERPRITSLFIGLGLRHYFVENVLEGTDAWGELATAQGAAKGVDDRDEEYVLALLSEIYLAGTIAASPVDLMSIARESMITALEELIGVGKYDEDFPLELIKRLRGEQAKASMTAAGKPHHSPRSDRPSISMKKQETEAVGIPRDGSPAERLNGFLQAVAGQLNQITFFPQRPFAEHFQFLEIALIGENPANIVNLVEKFGDKKLKYVFDDYEQVFEAHEADNDIVEFRVDKKTLEQGHQKGPFASEVFLVVLTLHFFLKDVLEAEHQAIAISEATLAQTLLDNIETSPRNRMDILAQRMRARASGQRVLASDSSQNTSPHNSFADLLGALKSRDTEVSLPLSASMLEAARMAAPAQPASHPIDVGVQFNPLRDDVGHISQRQGSDHFIGTAPNRFKLIGEISRGGMGVVYAAEDRYRRKVAIKVPRSDGAVRTDEKTIQLLQREVLYMADLGRKFKTTGFFPDIDHDENITQAVEGSDGTPFFVMHYIEGPTLEAVLKQRGQLEPELVINIAYTLSQALEKIHHHSQYGPLVHRDIKPSNIVVHIEKGKFQGITLLDFGLVISIEDMMAQGGGHVVGTPHYMSPETAGGDEPVANSSADIYSLGVIMYEMLTGKLPFSGSGPAGVLQAVTMGDYKPVNEHLPDVDPALAGFVHELMRKLHEGRPTEIGTVIDRLTALKYAKTGASVSGISIGSVPPPELSPVAPAKDSGAPTVRPAHSGTAPDGNELPPHARQTVDGSAPDVSTPAAQPAGEGGGVLAPIPPIDVGQLRETDGSHASAISAEFEVKSVEPDPDAGTELAPVKPIVTRRGFIEGGQQFRLRRAIVITLVVMAIIGVLGVATFWIAKAFFNFDILDEALKAMGFREEEKPKPPVEDDPPVTPKAEPLEIKEQAEVAFSGSYNDVTVLSTPSEDRGGILREVVDPQSAFQNDELSYRVGMGDRRNEPFYQQGVIKRHTQFQGRKLAWLLFDKKEKSLNEKKYPFYTHANARSSVKARIFFGKPNVGAVAFGFFDRDNDPTKKAMNLDVFTVTGRTGVLYSIEDVPVEIDKTTGNEYYGNLQSRRKEVEGVTVADLVRDNYLEIEFVKPAKGEEFAGKTADGQTIYVVAQQNNPIADAARPVLAEIKTAEDKVLNFGVYMAGPEDDVVQVGDVRFSSTVVNTENADARSEIRRADQSESRRPVTTYAQARRTILGPAVLSAQKAVVVMAYQGPKFLAELFSQASHLPLRDTALVFVVGPGKDFAEARSEVRHIPLRLYNAKLVRSTVPVGQLRAGSPALERVLNETAWSFGVTRDELRRAVVLANDFEFRHRPDSLKEARVLYMQADRIRMLGDPIYRNLLLAVSSTLSKGANVVFGVDFDGAHGAVQESLVEEFASDHFEFLALARAA